MQLDTKNAEEQVQKYGKQKGLQENSNKDVMMM